MNYTLVNEIFFREKYIFAAKLRGCRKAEIIPNEPDPDNAGGGKKANVSVFL